MITNTSIGITNTPIFTSAGAAAINLIVFCNTNTTLSAKLTVLVVPSGDSIAVKHTIIKQTVLNPLETLMFSQEKLILSTGDVVYALATQSDGSSPIVVVSTVSSIEL